MDLQVYVTVYVGLKKANIKPAMQIISAAINAISMATAQHPWIYLCILNLVLEKIAQLVNRLAYRRQYCHRHGLCNSIELAQLAFELTS